MNYKNQLKNYLNILSSDAEDKFLLNKDLQIIKNGKVIAKVNTSIGVENACRIVIMDIMKVGISNYMVDPRDKASNINTTRSLLESVINIINEENRAANESFFILPTKDKISVYHNNSRSITTKLFAVESENHSKAYFELLKQIINHGLFYTPSFVNQYERTNISKDCGYIEHSENSELKKLVNEYLFENKTPDECDEHFNSILDERRYSIQEESEKTVDIDRQEYYGDPIDNFKRISIVATELTGKELTSSDIAKVLVATKLSRETYKHKKDNLVDAIGYIEILNRIENETTR